MENFLKKIRQEGNKVVLQQIKDNEDNELSWITQKEIEEKKTWIIKKNRRRKWKRKQKNKLRTIENEKN